jgi:hypothetical protein
MNTKRHRFLEYVSIFLVTVVVGAVSIAQSHATTQSDNPQERGSGR